MLTRLFVLPIIQERRENPRRAIRSVQCRETVSFVVNSNTFVKSDQINE